MCFKMAEAMDSISCSICLEILKDPVTIPCGHSYCIGCIRGYWDQEDQKLVCSCPQCRQTFNPRPFLNRNTVMAEMVKTLTEKILKRRRRRRQLQTAPPAHCYAGPGDVECDVCTGTKLKAVKFCLVCLASYCETHLQPHYESPAFKKHKMVKASTQLQEKICSHHDKLLEVYCRTDQQCICHLCMLDKHKGHDTVSAAAEIAEKQRQLGEKSKQRIKEREKEMLEVRQAVKSFKHSTQAAVESSEKIFNELIRSIEGRRTEVKELIRAQEKANVSRAEGLLKQLEQEVAELKRREAVLEQLSHTEDHIHFLQSFQSLCVPPGSEALPSITINHHVSFEDVMKSVSELRNRLEDICAGEIIMLSVQMSGLHIVPPPVPRTREEFLKYYCQLTLDPNTPTQRLYLSEENTKVAYSLERQIIYPHNPERFQMWHQVLCKEGLSGACYWEVEWSGMVTIAVSYKGIKRHGGTECWFGNNDKSWCLVCYSDGCSIRHNMAPFESRLGFKRDFDKDFTKEIKIPVAPSSRVGVYLDHSAGTLSFYSVSDTMTLLHRVQTTFTEPLYPGFYCSCHSSVKIIPLP
ncbi:tripartite motif-containing protein 16-like isoform X1 [Oncorhynchus masou masou]|uniref:tripartite motif-containing protein 16-like isoform X1 n=1 Tax=Oncorhynchus masou masou TaxID=90313 RepID=UPI0031833700